MADPSGYKTFAAGEVLDAAAGVMAYLMDQVVTVWADASARTSGLTPAEGQVSYLKDTNTVYLYNGSAWVAVGGVSFSGTTADGLLTYSSATEIATESTATYASNTLTLTGAGGGLKMNGLNSSDVNTLDDYEEGTFDVTATVASGTLTVDTVRDTLKYTKIGNRVFIMGQIEFTTASTPSGAWSLGGLPFTNTNTGSYSVNKRPNISTGIESPATDIDPGSAFGWIEANSTTITMYQSGVAATAVLNANHIDTGTHVFITGQYVCDT